MCDQLQQGVQLLSMCLMTGQPAMAQAMQSIKRGVDGIAEARSGEHAVVVERLHALESVLAAVNSKQNDASAQVLDALDRLQAASQRSLTEEQAETLRKMCSGMLAPLEQQNRALYECVTQMRESQQRWSESFELEIRGTRETVGQVLEEVQNLRGDVFAGIHAAVRAAVGEYVARAADSDDAKCIAKSFVESLQSGQIKLTCCPVMHVPYTVTGDARPCRLPCGCVLSAKAGGGRSARSIVSAVQIHPLGRNGNRRFGG